MQKKRSSAVLGDDTSAENTFPEGEKPFQERRRFPRNEPERPIVPTSFSSLTPMRFSTSAYPPEAQFEAWRNYVEILFDARRPNGASAEQGFLGVHTVWNFGKILIAQQTASAHSYVRSAEAIKTSILDHWMINFLRRGKTWTEANGMVSQNEPGMVEIRSLGHPFRGRTEDAESLTVFVPRDLSAGLSMDALNNRVFAGSRASLMYDYLMRLDSMLPELGVEDIPMVVGTFRDMLLACISTVDTEPVSSTPTISLIARARRYVDQNISSPDLTPESVSQELGISRTRLYQLFEHSNGVSQFIKRRRLLAAHAALSNPDNMQRILELAKQCGFDTPANFSRAFRQEFGYTPREAREQTGDSLRISGKGTKTEASFNTWLLALAA